MNRILLLLILSTAVHSGRSKKKPMIPCERYSDWDSDTCHDKRVKEMDAFVAYDDVNEPMDYFLEHTVARDKALYRVFRGSQVLNSSVVVARDLFAHLDSAPVVAETSNAVLPALTQTAAAAEQLYAAMLDAGDPQVSGAVSVFRTLVDRINLNLHNVLSAQLKNENTLINRVSWYLLKYLSLLSGATSQSLQLAGGRGSQDLQTKDAAQAALVSNFLAKYDDMFSQTNAQLSDTTLNNLDVLSKHINTDKNVDNIRTFASSERERFVKTISNLKSVALAAFTQIAHSAAEDARKNRDPRLQRDTYAFEQVGARLNASAGDSNADVRSALEPLSPVVRAHGAELWTQRSAVLEQLKAKILPEVKAAIQEAGDWTIASISKTAAVEAEIQTLKGHALDAMKTQNFTENQHVLGLVMLADKTNAVEEQLKEETQQMKNAIVNTVSDLANSLGMSVESFFELAQNFEGAIDSLETSTAQLINKNTQVTQTEVSDLAIRMKTLLDESAVNLANGAISGVASQAQAAASIKAAAQATMTDALSQIQALEHAHTVDLKRAANANTKTAVSQAELVNKKLDDFAKLSSQLTATAEVLEKNAVKSQAVAEFRAAEVADTTAKSVEALVARVLEVTTRVRETASRELGATEVAFLRDMTANLRRVQARLEEQMKRGEEGHKKLIETVENFNASRLSVGSRLAKSMGLVDETSEALDSTQATSIDEFAKQAAAINVHSELQISQNIAFAEKNAELQRSSARVDHRRRMDDRQRNAEQYAASRAYVSTAQEAAVREISDLTTKTQVNLNDASTLEADNRAALNAVDLEIVNQIIAGFAKNLESAKSAVAKELDPAIDSADATSATSIEAWKTKAFADFAKVVSEVSQRESFRPTLGNISRASAASIDPLITNFTATFVGVSKQVTETLEANAAALNDKSTETRLGALLTLVETTAAVLQKMRAEANANLTALTQQTKSVFSTGQSSLETAVDATGKAISNAATSGKLGLSLGFGGFAGDAKIVSEDVKAAADILEVAKSAARAALSLADSEYADIVQSVDATKNTMQQGVSDALKQITSITNPSRQSTDSVVLDAAVTTRINDLMGLWQQTTADLDAKRKAWTIEDKMDTTGLTMDALGQRILDLGGQIQAFNEGEGARGFQGASVLLANIEPLKTNINATLVADIGQIKADIRHLVEAAQNNSDQRISAVKANVGGVKAELTNNLNSFVNNYFPQ